MFRGDVSPRKALAYIDRLPSHSAFADATAQDDELAEKYADLDVDPPPPPISEWTPERAELVKVNEAVRELTAVVITALGGKAEPPQPAPRPITAADRVREIAEDRGYEEIVRLVEESQKRQG